MTNEVAAVTRRLVEGVGLAGTAIVATTIKFLAAKSKTRMPRRRYVVPGAPCCVGPTWWEGCLSIAPKCAAWQKIPTP
jgi:hypothetical protein